MRKLASIQRIHSIEPIEGADRLELAKLLGWQSVVPKDVHEPIELVVYFEIDSLLPDEPRYEFLKKSSWNKRYEKIRLRSIKLRGVLSQGLIMPLERFPEIDWETIYEGMDVTELLGIEKYEPPVSVSMGGDVRSFTWPIAKTDEERIQSAPDAYLQAMRNKPYYITVKLDGTSATYLLDDENEYHVCSRNHSLRQKEGNLYWEMNKKYGIEKLLKYWFLSTGERYGIQGEIVGPGIQKNPLNLSENKLFVFNIIDMDCNEKVSYEAMLNMFQDIPKVPVLEEGESFPYTTMEELLELARGKYKEHFPEAVAKQDREGIVIRSKDQSVSVKAINNDYLLKNDV